MRRRRILMNTGKVFLGLAVTLLILEIGVRVFSPQRHFAVTVNCWDPVMGTRQRPGANGFVICPEYEIDLTINSHGLRDREYPYAKPPGTRRILSLGDSFTCGYGVQADETFSKQLEILLNDDEPDGVAWEVLNAGVGSTGTAQQLAYCEAEGYRYEPDFVVVCFFPGNDFWDNDIAGLYRLEDGRLIKQPAPRTGVRTLQRIVNLIPGYEVLFARSHLWNLMKHRVAARHFRQRTQRLSNAESWEEIMNRRDDLTYRLFLALRDSCRARNIRLAVAVIPAPAESQLPRRTARLMQFFAAQDIPCLDLAEPLDAAMDSAEPLYYRVDGHWTAAGHAVVATALHTFLVTECL